jgi:peptidoglycan hydrolase-like protein with peptidoglycan-binding domain
MRLLCAGSDTGKKETMALLMRGLRGEAVTLLQQRLGLDDDGIFGGGTEKAVKAYQEENGLAADGKAGADTFASMGLYDLILLRRGSKGGLVKKMQAALEIDDDGKFGAGTEKSVREYQEKNELEVDGLAGPQSLLKLGVLGPEAEAAAKGAALWASVGESTEGTLDKLKSLFS